MYQRKIHRFLWYVICRKRRKRFYQVQQLEADLFERAVEEAQARIFGFLVDESYEEAVNLLRLEVFQISESGNSPMFPSPPEVHAIRSSIFGSVSSFAFIPFAIGNEIVDIPSKPNVKGARHRKSLSKLPANVIPHKKTVTEHRPIKFSLLRHRVETSRAAIDNPCSLQSTVRDVSEFTKHRSFSFNLQNISVEDVTDECLREVSNPGYEGLIANVNKLTSLENLSISYPNLKVASLSDNHVLSLIGAVSLPNLLHLNLDSNRLEGGSELVLPPKLLSLSLNCNKLQSLSIVESIPLQRLSLYSNSISKSSSISWRAVGNLVYLNLGRNELCSIQWEELSHLTYLNTLILSQNRLSSFPEYLDLPFLQSLWLNGNCISGVCFLSAGVNLPLLKRLYLQDNRICMVDRSVAAAAPNLTEIDVSFNNISSPGAILHLARFRFLRSIRLSDNPLTTSGRDVVDIVQGTLLKWGICDSSQGLPRATKFTPRENEPYQYRLRQQLGYYIRNLLEVAFVKRKRLLADLRQSGKSVADIEATSFCDDVNFSFPNLLAGRGSQAILLSSQLKVVSVSLSFFHAASLPQEIFGQTASAPKSTQRPSAVNYDRPIEKTFASHVSESNTIPVVNISPTASTHAEVAVRDRDNLSGDAGSTSNANGVVNEAFTRPSNMSRESDHDNLTSDPEFTSMTNDVLNEAITASSALRENAAKKLQSFFCSWRRRRKTKAVMETVRFKDDEVDELLADEIEMGWLNEDFADILDPTTSKPPATSSSATLVRSQEDGVHKDTFAYGDHVRKRSLQLDIHEVHRAVPEEVKILTSKSAPSQASVNSVMSKVVVNEIKDEWGIQNDYLLSTMLKRQKKMRYDIFPIVSTPFN